MNSAHLGSSFDDFLKEEAIYEEAKASAIKRALVEDLREAMRRCALSQAALAREMGTSRSAIGRLLDPDDSALTLKTLAAAARVLGVEVKLELVPTVASAP